MDFVVHDHLQKEKQKSVKLSYKHYSVYWVVMNISYAFSLFSVSNCIYFIFF